MRRNGSSVADATVCLQRREGDGELEVASGLLKVNPPWRYWFVVPLRGLSGSLHDDDAFMVCGTVETGRSLASSNACYNVCLHGTKPGGEEVGNGGGHMS